MKNIREIIKATVKGLKPWEKKALEELQGTQDGWVIGGENREYTAWEKKVMARLSKSKIEFEKKFRTFPLQIDDSSVSYTPDFLLDFAYKNRRSVIVEVHEDLTDFDVKKFSTFMDVYGRIYYLIVVVSDGQLRKWNEIDHGNHVLFHDIWTLNDIELMISQLEKLRHTSKKQYEGEETNCPKCGKTARGKFEIEELFGYRGKYVQSQCKVCRSRKSVNENKDHKIKQKPKLVYCPGCGKNFMEKERGELFCESCIGIYYSKIRR